MEGPKGLEWCAKRRTMTKGWSSASKALARGGRGRR